VKPVNEAESTEPGRVAIERELEGAIAFEQVVSGVIELPTLAVVASPTGFANVGADTGGSYSTPAALVEDGDDY